MSVVILLKLLREAVKGGNLQSEEYMEGQVVLFILLPLAHKCTSSLCLSPQAPRGYCQPLLVKYPVSSMGTKSGLKTGFQIKD